MTEICLLFTCVPHPKSWSPNSQSNHTLGTHRGDVLLGHQPQDAVCGHFRLCEALTLQCRSVQQQMCVVARGGGSFSHRNDSMLTKAFAFSPLSRVDNFNLQIMFPV